SLINKKIRVMGGVLATKGALINKGFYSFIKILKIIKIIKIIPNQSSDNAKKIYTLHSTLYTLHSKKRFFNF
ncbi:MAG: hypothetical protein LBR36_02430, partial [Bacteroidales bacterium]|nr:hypothetical protein [Bacteroidales bacterium]